MKQEYEEIIMKAMPLLVSDLVVDTSFMAYFEQHGVLDEDTRREIMVRWQTCRNCDSVVITKENE